MLEYRYWIITVGGKCANSIIKVSDASARVRVNGPITTRRSVSSPGRFRKYWGFGPAKQHLPAPQAPNCGDRRRLQAIFTAHLSFTRFAISGPVVTAHARGLRTEHGRVAPGAARAHSIAMIVRESPKSRGISQPAHYSRSLLMPSQPRKRPRTGRRSPPTKPS